MAEAAALTPIATPTALTTETAPRQFVITMIKGDGGPAPNLVERKITAAARGSAAGRRFHMHPDRIGFTSPLCSML